MENESGGNTALLVEGARRIGKSTVVEEFAKNEYESYILVDFATASKEVRELFDDVSDLNYLFAASASVQKGSARTKVGYHI
ncbi:MAG: AAA family ATPase [[Eubacterium] siraeum]